MTQDERTILHCDMDAFYASVEQRDNPDLRGVPVLVGGHRERGVVCACSYEARPFGIRSGMAMARALQLCPQARVLPVRMERYRQVSGQIFEIFHQYSDLVEPLSVDEAFIDVTASRRLHGDGPEIAASIRQTVRDELDLPVSVGVASNKFLAKLCSEEAKPDGIHVLRAEDVERYLSPLPLGRIWGLGPRGVEKLKRYGCRTVADALRLSPDRLRALFGVQGERLYRLLRGQDDRPVIPGEERKSVGAEETFVADLVDLDEIERQLWRLADQVCRRVRGLGLGGTVVTLKLRGADRTVRTRSHSFAEVIDQAEPMVAWAQSQLADLVGGQPVRLLGIYLGGLSAVSQLGLFARDERRRKLDRVRDNIRERYGERGLTRASLIGLSGSVQRRADGVEDGD
ncbi:MAG: DNA polymerase IV [Geothermobacteraceae bacterium]